MGRRSNMGMARAGTQVQVHEQVHVHVLHPADDDSRWCALRFSARGLVLDSAGDGPARRLLRVPWWAIHGFAADDAVLVPGGGREQALDLLTDAGRLRLALPAPDVVVTMSLLALHAKRWRRWRLPPLRWAARQLTSASPAWHDLAARCTTTVRATRRRPVLAVGIGVAALTLASGTVAVAAEGGTPHRPQVSTASAWPTVAVSGMARLVAAAHARNGSTDLAPAAAPPPPAPPSITGAPALSPHEVFGFVPYWMLGEEASFDVSSYTTLAYFAVGVDANGTLSEEGTGWDGYESQDFADLVARAHDAGVRVVLTVNCFSLPALEQLTSSNAAASTLTASVLSAIRAKNLDGVNIDFEGGGPLQRQGFSALVASLSSAVHAANPRFQVTVDTDGDSAGDPDTFYDVRALASASDGLFVMAYGLNYDAPPDAASPITSDELSDVTEATQYAAAVPPAKVIFGTSFFGYSWATTNGTMAARAAATGTPLTYGQVVASGHPMYWDPVTDTAWTSYETDGVWHEDYVDDPASVYLVAALAEREGFAGVGAWAVGMDGADPQMTAALDGKAPAEHAGLAGPAWTPPSKSQKSGSSGVTPDVEAPPGVGAGAGSSPATTSPTTTTTTATTTTATTTTATTTTATTTLAGATAAPTTTTGAPVTPSTGPPARLPTGAPATPSTGALVTSPTKAPPKVTSRTSAPTGGSRTGSTASSTTSSTG